jgi:predicted transcriptional regulator
MSSGFLRKSQDRGRNVEHALRIMEMTGDPIDKVLVKERAIDDRTFSQCLKRHTEATVYRAIALTGGNFLFEKTLPPVFAHPIQLKVDDILLEGARRSDEWVLIQQRIPSFDLVFEPMIGNAEELSTRGLSEIDSSVFSLVNGQRTVQNIIDELNACDFDVAKSLFILLSVNLIRQKR